MMRILILCVWGRVPTWDSSPLICPHSPPSFKSLMSLFYITHFSQEAGDG